MPDILTKAQHQEHYLAGHYGPPWPVWTLDEAEGSDLPLITIRCLEPGSPFCKYDVPREALRSTVRQWVEEGADQSKLYYQPFLQRAHLLLLQGEWDGLYLRYTQALKPMRQALAVDECHAEGGTARLLMRQAMAPASYEDVFSVLERFPDHVLEFSCWSADLPWAPGRNTQIWEVRKY